jgi:plasmid stability protein
MTDKATFIVRNVDRDTKRKIKAIAATLGLSMGEALAAIVGEYLKGREGK